VDPNYSLTYATLATIQLGQLKECSEAEKNLNIAISLDPEKQYYLLKYLVYKNCFKDQKKMDSFRKYYSDRFKYDIQTEFKPKKKK
jgi:hypothetical protein